MTTQLPQPSDDADPFDEQGAAWTRRRLLGVLGGGAAVALAGGAAASRWSAAAASGAPDTAPPGTGLASAPISVPDECSVIPEETAGPFPGDGSNGPNLLDDDGIVRQDLTASYGTSTTVAEGVPLTLELLVVDVAGGCLPLQGAAVYAWHCDREGRYSLYSTGVEEENYLRGVQAAGADGLVTFTSIFPACYPGRWPHVHFEVYPTLADAVAGSNRLATSQLALPQDVCETVYATEGYEQSVPSLAELSLETDGVFRDGVSTQLATTTGSVDDGYTAQLVVGV